MRAYSAPPAHDIRQYLTTFDSSTYSTGTAAVLYRPAIDPATGKRVAVDPRTGILAPNPYIGLFVPGSGSYAPGMVVGGVGNTPGSLYTTPLSFGSALRLRLTIPRATAKPRFAAVSASSTTASRATFSPTPSGSRRRSSVRRFTSAISTASCKPPALWGRRT